MEIVALVKMRPLATCRHALLLLTLMCNAAARLHAVVAADEPQTASAVSHKEVEVLLERYRESNKKYERLRPEVASAAARAELRARLLPPVPNDLAVVEWASANPTDALALRCLRLVIEYGPFSAGAEHASSSLLANHLNIQGQDFRLVLMALQGTPPMVADGCLRGYLEKSQQVHTRAMACWGLGLYYAQLLSWSQYLDAVVLDDQGRGFSNSWIPHLKELDSERALAESEALLRRAMTEFGDVEVHLGPDRKIKLAVLARKDHDRLTREFKTLAIGEVAPDIDGKDVFGNSLKLSSHRGKVVVIVFWSTSCIPCMKMFPHERELIKKYGQQQFSLFGVNVDPDCEQVREAMKKHEITWPNWWDGGDSQRAISKCWGLSTLPAVYVLDGDGIIRHKHLRGEQLDQAIALLLLSPKRHDSGKQ